MEIGIFGCSHSFGTGKEIVDTLYELNENSNNKLHKGYGAILAELYPQHNFTLFPVLGGGNKDILENLTYAIENNPCDMYIVQTTQWHRFTFGILQYIKKLFNIGKNMQVYTYDTSTYHGQRTDIDKKYLPNYCATFLPCQPIYSDVPGTGHSQFIWGKDWCAEGADEMKEVYGQAITTIIMDHFASNYFLDENYMMFNMLNMLSQQHNIWYFYWNPPFGKVKDLQYVDPKTRKDVLTLKIDLLNEKWKTKTRDKEIQSQDIETFLNKKIGTKKVVTDYVIDSGTHLNNKAHKMVVDYLLSNENFKKELEWK